MDASFANSPPTGRPHGAEFQILPASAAFVPHPVAAPAVAPRTPRAPIAGLEQPVDLVILVIGSRDEVTISRALALLPDLLPCAVILAVSEASPIERTPRDLQSIACVHGITEADREEILVPGHVWVAPAGRTLTLAPRGRAVHTVLLEPLAPDSLHALDALLGSAATTFGPRTLVVVIGGSAADGVAGCTRIRSEGGRIIQASPAGNDPTQLSTVLLAAHVSHGSWPLADLGPVVRDCISHGRHDPRKAPKS